VLLQRVLADSRKEHGKPTDPQTLEQMLNEYDNFTTLAAADSLTIDLSATSANDAADRIIDHLANG
jgi:hypothetical protein